MSETTRIEPNEVVHLVESYVGSELASSAKYDNKTPLDEDGIFTLHRLAAEIYAIGYRDGEMAQINKSLSARLRLKDGLTTG